MAVPNGESPGLGDSQPGAGRVPSLAAEAAADCGFPCASAAACLAAEGVWLIGERRLVVIHNVQFDVPIVW